MAAKYATSVKLLILTTTFFGLLIVLILLLSLFLNQASQNPDVGLEVSDNVTGETASPLPPQSSPEPEVSPDKTHTSLQGWEVTYPTLAKADTTIEAGSPSVERLTISELATDQPTDPDTFFGYSVDISVEPKQGTLQAFGDQDSRNQDLGRRTSFGRVTINNKAGFKAAIDGVQDYESLYLPLRNTNQVLVLTTSVAGPDLVKYRLTVQQILDSLKLLD